MFIDLKNGVAVHSDFVRSVIVRKANGEYIVIVKMRTDNSNGAKLGANRIHEIKFNDLAKVNAYTEKYFQMDPLTEKEIETKE